MMKIVIQKKRIFVDKNVKSAIIQTDSTQNPKKRRTCLLIKNEKIKRSDLLW